MQKKIHVAIIILRNWTVTVTVCCLCPQICKSFSQPVTRILRRSFILGGGVKNWKLSWWANLNLEKNDGDPSHNVHDISNQTAFWFTMCCCPCQCSVPASQKLPASFIPKPLPVLFTPILNRD